MYTAFSKNWIFCLFGFLTQNVLTGVWKNVSSFKTAVLHVHTMSQPVTSLVQIVALDFSAPIVSPAANIVLPDPRMSANKTVSRHLHYQHCSKPTIGVYWIILTWFLMKTFRILSLSRIRSKNHPVLNERFLSQPNNGNLIS